MVKMWGRNVVLLVVVPPLLYVANVWDAPPMLPLALDIIGTLARADEPGHPGGGLAAPSRPPVEDAVGKAVVTLVIGDRDRATGVAAIPARPHPRVPACTAPEARVWLSIQIYNL